ncbi:hypothetical protein [Halanaeroarchaeum sulfurireducens]|uniref:Uncharacterized protein n=1 Tax=Halanaeroarchaeum sulfurireducens TaxID=1604004 RepID=A0A0F7PEG0_9EURY|nr:hypothetical protein [Halanaeroarchaeum sulfurireducens]AKH97683.1 hypothetical protein HLASF_1196 [Halanaeroarchaeum sulfurireducens]ALG82078.1 hypothetical protein HLASA_1184 [Halanaeroarchaeum sulfurireducens]
MAAVPPPSDEDEPDAVAFGIPALDDRLRRTDVDFPIRAEELVDELGNPDVPYDPSGRTISLSEAVDRSGRDRFETRRDFLNALHPVFEDARSSGGIRGWLERFIPL